jgi:outer membrane protein OmpA-like peptidoglycan-associated protein
MLTAPYKLCFIMLCCFYASATHAQTVFMLDGASTADDVSAALSGRAPARKAGGFNDGDDDFDMQNIIVSSSGQDALESETETYRASDADPAQAAAFVPPGIAANASALGLRINFDNNSSQIAPSYEKVIASLAYALKESPDSYILITGHADSRGTEHYNQLLSFERAASLRRSLAERGLPAWRVVVMGYGSLMPLPGLTERDPRNRRIQIWKMAPDVTGNSQHIAARNRYEG